MVQTVVQTIVTQYADEGEEEDREGMSSAFSTILKVFALWSLFMDRPVWRLVIVLMVVIAMPRFIFLKNTMMMYRVSSLLYLLVDCYVCLLFERFCDGCH